MTTREAKRIVRRHGRDVTYYWRGTDLVRSAYDPASGCYQERVWGNCLRGSKTHVMREAWLAEVDSCERVAADREQYGQ